MNTLHADIVVVSDDNQQLVPHVVALIAKRLRLACEGPWCWSVQVLFQNLSTGVATLSQLPSLFSDGLNFSSPGAPRTLCAVPESSTHLFLGASSDPRQLLLLRSLSQSHWSSYQELLVSNLRVPSSLSTTTIFCGPCFFFFNKVICFLLFSGAMGKWTAVGVLFDKITLDTLLIPPFLFFRIE